MALIKCRECGQEISDKAAACPHCGAPLSVGPPVTKPGRLGLLFAIVIGTALAVVMVLPALRKVGVIKSASFTVENVGGDESCSVLGEYCLRVQCAAVNTGTGQGSVRIVAEIVPDTGQSFTHTTTRVLSSGERQVIALDFPEAVMGPHYTFRCNGEPSP